MKKRIGLIGTGRVGKVHAQSVFEENRAELAITADVFVEGSKSVSEAFGGDFTANPLDVFNSEKVDLVIIASPTSTHVDLIEAAIDSGIPAICEKPIDLDIAKVEALAKKVSKSKTPIMIGFNRRFDPAVMELHRLTQAGAIGSLEQLSIVSRDPSPASMDYLRASGGIFRDMTIHDFDMARNFIPDIVRVTARGFNQFDEEIAKIPDFDSTSIILEGADGQSIQITNSRHSASGFDQRIEAFGSEGMLRMENLSESTIRLYDRDHTEKKAPWLNFFLERHAQSFRNELASFLSVLEGSDIPYPSFDDGRKALILANAALESAMTEKTIEISG
mgnify:CR=1 FL=1